MTNTDFAKNLCHISNSLYTLDKATGLGVALRKEVEETSGSVIPSLPYQLAVLAMLEGG